MNEARAVRDLGATLCELVEIKSELMLVSSEKRVVRSPSRIVCASTHPHGLLSTHYSLLTNLQARHDAKRGGNGGEDGDEDLQDFAPDGCFVCFHGFEKVKGERLKVNVEG